MRVQVVAILGTLGLLVIVVELVRRKQLAEGYSLLWLLAAAVLLGLAVWRDMLYVLARAIGIYYPPTALFVVALGFVLFILLQFSAIISRLSWENKKLAQQVALLNWKIEHPGPKAGRDEA